MTKTLTEKTNKNVKLRSGLKRFLDGMIFYRAVIGILIGSMPFAIVGIKNRVDSYKGTHDNYYVYLSNQQENSETFSKSSLESLSGPNILETNGDGKIDYVAGKILPARTPISLNQLKYGSEKRKQKIREKYQEIYDIALRQFKIDKKKN